MSGFYGNWTTDANVLPTLPPTTSSWDSTTVGKCRSSQTHSSPVSDVEVTGLEPCGSGEQIIDHNCIDTGYKLFKDDFILYFFSPDFFFFSQMYSSH